MGLEKCLGRDSRTGRGSAGITASRLENRYQASADDRRKAGSAVCLEGLQTCEIECHSLCPGRPDGRRWGGTDEPRGFLSYRCYEGGLTTEGYRSCFRCLFPLSRRSG